MRNTFVVLGLILIAVAGGAYFFLYGPSGLSATVTSNASVVTVPFVKIARGYSSTVERRVNYLISSPDGLNKLWKMVDATTTPPTVDFNKEAIIAVFAGQQPTTGYAIEVSKVLDSSSRLVSITLAKPDSTCITGQALTAPYEIVAVPATTLSFTHEDQVIIATCTN